VPNSHYYDRACGQVVKRLPSNPIKKAGSNSGRQQRHKDQQRGVYPRPGLPISREGREPLWISAYQESYYQPKAEGRPMLGNEPRVTISVTVDRQLLEQADLLGINRSAALEVGLKQQINTP